MSITMNLENIFSGDIKNEKWKDYMKAIPTDDGKSVDCVEYWLRFSDIVCLIVYRRQDNLLVHVVLAFAQIVAQHKGPHRGHALGLQGHVSALWQQLFQHQQPAQAHVGQAQRLGADRVEMSAVLVHHFDAEESSHPSHRLASRQS